jgi:hypothetical protein
MRNRLDREGDAQRTPLYVGARSRGGPIQRRVIAGDSSSPKTWHGRELAAGRKRSREPEGIRWRSANAPEVDFVRFAIMKALLPFGMQSSHASGTPAAVDDRDANGSATCAQLLSPHRSWSSTPGVQREAQAMQSARNARLIPAQHLSRPPAPRSLDGRTAIPVREQSSFVDPNERRWKRAR